MVIYADHYLLTWEREHKAASERWRSVARNGQSSLLCSFISKFLVLPLPFPASVALAVLTDGKQVRTELHAS